MAEGFARKYGSDVMQAASAGLAPAAIVQPLTKKVMEAKNIQIEDQFPKSLDQVGVAQFDLIINISGKKLPGNMQVEVQDWPIEDPIGQSEETYVVVRDELENRVMRLILDLRRDTHKAPAPTRRFLGHRAKRAQHVH